MSTLNYWVESIVHNHWRKDRVIRWHVVQRETGWFYYSMAVYTSVEVGPFKSWVSAAAECDKIHKPKGGSDGTTDKS